MGFFLLFDSFQKVLSASSVAGFIDFRLTHSQKAGMASEGLRV